MASKDQAQGIEQLNIGVANIDKVTQANAAQAEHASKAASELNEQAERLKEVSRDLTILVIGRGDMDNSFDDVTEAGWQETSQFLLPGIKHRQTQEEDQS